MFCAKGNQHWNSLSVSVRLITESQECLEQLFHAFADVSAVFTHFALILVLTRDEQTRGSHHDLQFFQADL